MKKYFFLLLIPLLLLGAGCDNDTIKEQQKKIDELSGQVQSLTNQLASSTEKTVNKPSQINIKEATPKPTSTPDPSPTPAPAPTPTPPTPTQPETPKSWQTVARFSGTGKQYTDDFVITGTKFKVIWSHTGENLFSIDARIHEDNYDYCAVVISEKGTLSNYKICQTSNKSKTYFMDIDAEFLGTKGSWTIEVQDWK